MSRNSPYKHIRANRPGRSVFNLSYEKKFTCDMGQLIPVMCDEVVPGDYFKIGNQALIRFQPLVSPIMHEINMYVHYFFVPYRLLWEDWEDYITGGVDGDDASTLPTWVPTNTAVGSLWDYMGFPTGVDPDPMYPVDFPRRAYARIWNEYYRDENLQTEVAETNESILNRAWEKDYFTSALLEQQRGTAPALPISGMAPVKGIAKYGTTWPGMTDDLYETGGTGKATWYASASPSDVGPDGVIAIRRDGSTNYPLIQADLSSATTFDVADLRLAFQIQRWMELNNRAGVRYTEFLKAHFGVSPHDARLQRPEYIGGSKSPIIISEVLQTSKTDTSPQGNMAGHGITVSDSYCGKCRIEEYGLIMGIMSVMPKPAYSQGIPRQWIKQTKYDFYFPEFANLSEQAIYNAEICAVDGDDVHNAGIFGFQGRYDEMRTKQNLLCGQLRPNQTYDYWTLGRAFNTASPPSLNDTFVTCNPTLLKSIFAAPSEPGLIVSFGNVIKAVRPMPVMAEPGRIDH